MRIKKIENKIEELVQIWLQTNKEAHSFIEEEYWNKNITFVKQALLQATIFCEGEQPIKGFLGMVEGQIEGLFVRKEFQHSGIGTSLVKEAKQYFDTLSLCVYQKNTNAISFYQKMGFVVEKEQLEQHTGEMEYRMVWKNKEKP